MNDTNFITNKQQQRSDSLFYSTIPLVLRYEGGYTDNPNDRGGRTNMGVTQGFLDTYKERAGVSVDDVRHLKEEDAIELYRTEWNIYGFGKLDNSNVMKLVYDFAVNSGPQVAIKYLQRILNSKGKNLAVDGYIGENTNRAANSVDEKWLVREIQKSRAEHCDRIVDQDPKQREFIKGWFNRINDIGKKCGCNTVFRSRHL
jgi:lysozyme family protein